MKFLGFNSFAAVVMALFILCTLFPLQSVQAGWFGEKGPEEIDLKKELQKEIPGYFEVGDFKLVAIENVGTKVEPRWVSRFKAKVKNKEPLFLSVGYEEHVPLAYFTFPKTVTFLTLKTDMAAVIEVYGKVVSTVSKEAFKHNLTIEDSPLHSSTIGTPKSDFKSNMVIIKGSKQEIEYHQMVSEGKKKQATDLENASQILIGTWIRPDYSQDNERYPRYITFFKNGTYYGTCLPENRFCKNAGARWLVVDGAMIVLHEYPKAIEYIDQNAFRLSTRVLNGVGEAKRVFDQKIINEIEENAKIFFSKYTEDRQVQAFWAMIKDRNEGKKKMK